MEAPVVPPVEQGKPQSSAKPEIKPSFVQSARDAALRTLRVLGLASFVYGSIAPGAAHDEKRVLTDFGKVAAGRQIEDIQDDMETHAAASQEDDVEQTPPPTKQNPGQQERIVPHVDEAVLRRVVADRKARITDKLTDDKVVV